MPVTIELFGVPRLRAGRDLVEVEAATLGDALQALCAACPGLGALLASEDPRTRSCLVAINGGRFTDDLGTRLRDGDVLVLVSAQAGG